MLSLMMTRKSTQTGFASVNPPLTKLCGCTGPLTGGNPVSEGSMRAKFKGEHWIAPTANARPQPPPALPTVVVFR
jgi:hypothetical protein